jgi:hypothetical protein
MPATRVCWLSRDERPPLGSAEGGIWTVSLSVEFFLRFLRRFMAPPTFRFSSSGADYRKNGGLSFAWCA